MEIQPLKIFHTFFDTVGLCMTRVEKFSLFTAIIGLAADVLAIGGVALGMVKLPQQGPILGNPWAIAALSLIALTYSLVVFTVIGLHYCRSRWAESGYRPTSKYIEDGVRTFSALMIVPCWIIWCIAMMVIFDAHYLQFLNPSEKSADLYGHRIVMVLVALFGMPVAGFLFNELIPYAAFNIYMMVNPKGAAIYLEND